MKIKILVADDHKLFRQGLISLIRTSDELVEVVGEAETGKEAIYLTEILRPDVVLMDIYMPQGDGLYALEEIRRRFPEISVVMLTSSESDEHIYKAVRLGASGFLLKSLDAIELFELLDGVGRGEAALTRAMATRLLRYIANRSSHTGGEEDALTERELAVIRLVAKGHSNPQIAEELCISINTVKSHLRNILEKLQLENRTQAAAYALRRGLLSKNCDT